jgi:hypothetical protein
VFEHFASQVNRGTEDDHEYPLAQNHSARTHKANSLTKTLRHAAAAAGTNVCKTNTQANENIWLNAQQSSIVTTKNPMKVLTEREGSRRIIQTEPRNADERTQWYNRHSAAFRRFNKLTTQFTGKSRVVTTHLRTFTLI